MAAGKVRGLADLVDQAERNYVGRANTYRYVSVPRLRAAASSSLQLAGVTSSAIADINETPEMFAWLIS